MASPTPREIAMEARKREFDAKRRAANRQSRANLLGMASNPGALLRGALDIPGSVYRYVRGNEPVEIGEDVSGIASDMAADFRKDPVKFAVDMVNPMSSVQDFADVRAQARDLRAAGDLDTASTMEQVAAMSPLAVVPVVGKVLGKGAKAAAKRAAKKAASLAVKPVKAAAEKAPLAVERAGIRAYHGSPHKFDKFDVSKIGTGEGAQSYGYGLYFAEHPDTATAYREALKGMADNPARNAKLTDLAKQMEAEIRPGGGYRQFKDQKGHALAAEYDRTMQERADDKGHMYEVNINADPNHFLDLNKPLSEQPLIVQDMARNADLSHLKPGNRTRRQIEMWRDGTLPNKESEPTGNVLHSALTDYGMNTKNNAALTGKFKAAGIPGIRYLDQGSRGAGSGTSNYVVFDPDLLEIKRRYAKGGATNKAHGGRVSPLAVKRK